MCGSTAEARRLFRISLGKLECLRATRVSKSLHKNLLVSTVFNKVISIVNDVEDLVIESTCTSALISNVSAKSKAVDTNFRRSSVKNTDGSGAGSDDVETEFLADLPCLISDSEDSSSDTFTIISCSTMSSISSSGSNSDEQPNDRAHSSPALKRSSTGDEVATKRRRTSDSIDGASYNTTPAVSPIRNTWRSSPMDTLDTFTSDEGSESDMETESDGSDNSVASDENVAKNMEQVSNLVSVFSSSFAGLGDIHTHSESSSPVKSRDESSIRERAPSVSSSPPPLRRVSSLPNLGSIAEEPKPKRKNSLVGLRI